MQVKKKPKKTAKAVPEKSRKKKQPSEDQIKKQPFLKRMLFGEEKPDLSELEAGSTTILDILSPTTVDTKSRDYIIVDDVYHAYLYITGYGYTTTVGTCWFAPLVEAGEGINLSFLVKRQPKEKILSKIAQTTMVNRSRMRDVGDTRQDYEELDSAISSGLYLKDVMNRQGENFYYMHTLIEVTAPDSETLEQRVTEVEKLCVSVDMIARRCDYKNEQAFLSALPILALDPDIERKARRNALTSGVAAAFPFVSYELSDHDGIFLGLNLYNRSPVFLNPYDDYKYTSGNWWIGGSTGAGKTVTLQCLGGRLREQGKRVIIIVPKKGHEFRPLCERLGGLYLRMSPSSKDCPNLMAIRRKSLDSYAKLKNIAARDDSVLADKIAQLIIWFSLKKKDLNEEDKSRLDSSLVEVYKRYGITFDNSTIVDENGNFRTMPILSDWYEILYQEQDTRHLAVVLSRYVTGSAAAMAGRNDIELNNKYIVLDLSGMPDDMIADGTFWATSIAYDLIMNCEDELSALLADELWSLVGAMSVRDMDVLRLLCWCQNVRPDDLSSISTETERENLITLGLIKRHQRSDTLLLTNSGRAFLQAALEGDVPNLTLSYHDAAIERRVRLSSLMMTAYHAGINVFTITANSLAEPSTLFITAITRSRGHNPWGSARVGAIAHLGSTYYAVHYIYSGIGRMAVNDELAAFHNHTNFGKDTQRAFLFAGASYADIMEELKARDEKRDAKLIRYSEAYRGLHYPVHLLSCDETGARQLQIMAVPDYRVKISKLMLRSAYRPPPEDAPAWDATYQNRPFVIGADMNLRRIDAAIASAKKRGCLPISLAALDAQGDAVLLRRYKDTGYAVIYKVTESVLTELFGHPPSLYLPPCTQYLTKKGAVVDAPLIQVDRKDRGSPRK